ncbi:4-oxalocrotonate tautomerase DmpI [Streptomyces cinnamoneus]
MRERFGSGSAPAPRDELFPSAERTGTAGAGVSTEEHIMPIVTIQQGPRDIELKRELVARVTDAFVDSLNIPAEAVQVWIHEVPTDSWGVAGKLTADK